MADSRHPDKSPSWTQQDPAGPAGPSVKPAFYQPSYLTNSYVLFRRVDSLNRLKRLKRNLKKPKSSITTRSLLAGCFNDGGAIRGCAGLHLRTRTSVYSSRAEAHVARRWAWALRQLGAVRIVQSVPAAGRRLEEKGGEAEGPGGGAEGSACRGHARRG